jgi:hypothetical protein
MQVLLTMVCLLALTRPAFADDCLPSRDLAAPPLIVSGREPESFDLLDFRDEERAAARARRGAQRVDAEPHTIFIVKQHVGIAGGFDNGVGRGSVGFYLTVAEWGRWNFGVPSPEIGIGRYDVYDLATHIDQMKEQLTFLISVASVHYRLGYLRSWGLHAYLNLEQVYDVRSNEGASQFGLSFSSK